MLHTFSLAPFRFGLETEERLALHPRNPGNTLRGAFGSTFKRLVCPTPRECHDICLLKATCPYGQIFEQSPPPGCERLSLNLIRSWKTGFTHDMGGFVGEATYEGDLQEFLPLLILGPYTHVGKYAVWGNGQYEVRVL